MKWIATLALMLSCLPAFAAKDFSSWRKFTKGELIAETTALAPGSVGTAGLYITLEDHWHTYWVNPGDSGAALRLSFNNSKGVRVKRVLMPRPERVMAGPLVSFAYSNEVLFPIEVELAPSVAVGSEAKIVVDAEWLVCSDVCIPAFQTFELTLPVKELAAITPSDKFAVFQKGRAMIPVAAEKGAAQWDPGATGRLLKFPGVVGAKFVDFFPHKGAGVTNEKPTVHTGSPLALEFKESTVPKDKEDRFGLLIVERDGKLEAIEYGDSKWEFQDQSQEGGGAGHQSLWWMLISAFLGGLILNLMPCVFPILSIKLLSILKLGKSHAAEIRSQNFAYVAGVLASFLTIALLLSALRSAGNLIGWGFQLQSPVFLTLLCWLFFLLSLNLFGVFELEFLNAGAGGKLTRISGLWGSFFTGVLAVVVASPCTAPFMGVALGFGLTQSTVYLIAIFVCLGLGLAFPYLLIAVFPGSVRALPRPGKWMNVLKQVMAFPLLLTMLWLLWILSSVRGTNAVIAVLVGCVALGFIFWLPGKKMKKIAKAVAAVVLLVGLYFINSLDMGAKVQAGSDIWQPYSEATMERLKGQNVFIDMTADWCLTCKVNERLVLSDSEVMALLEAKKVVLVKGDWTQRNAEITRFLNRYDRVGVPFYVLYSPQHPQGLPLPEVLTKSSFMDLIKTEFP